MKKITIERVKNWFLILVWWFIDPVKNWLLDRVQGWLERMLKRVNQL